MKSCKACEFSMERKASNGDVLALECRRLPPTIHANLNYKNSPLYFPVVKEDYWCGEYSKKRVEMKLVDEEKPKKKKEKAEAA